jgi:hypothetical protein
VLLNTTSFVTLSEQISLILDGDEYEILVNKLNPDFSPLFTTIKHSMDASGTRVSDEESCSENKNSEGYKVVVVQRIQFLQSIRRWIWRVTFLSSSV